MPTQISSRVQFDDLSGHDVRYDDITSAAFYRRSMMMTTLDLPLSITVVTSLRVGVADNVKLGELSEINTS